MTTVLAPVQTTADGLDVSAARDRSYQHKTIIWALFVAVVAVTATGMSVPVLLALLSITPISLLVRHRHLEAGVAIAQIFYCASAWIAYEGWQLHFAPYPDRSTIEVGTVLSLRIVAVTTVVFLAVWWYLGLARRASSILAASHAEPASERSGSGGGTPSGPPLWLAITFLAGVGVHDLLTWVRIGPGAILSGGRRAFYVEFLATGNNIVGFIALPITVALATCLFNGTLSRNGKRAAITGLALYWLPYLGTGARRELITVGLALLFVLPIRYRRYIPRIVTVVVGLAILLPIVWNSDQGSETRYDLAFHEFVRPQYLLFSSQERGGQMPFSHSYEQNYQMLLPAPLRSSPVQEVGASFLELGLVNTGIGAHPVGEAHANADGNPRTTMVLASGAFLGLMLLAAAVCRVAPNAAPLAYALIFLWGRSEIWMMASALLFYSVITWVLGQRVTAVRRL